jgi:hypothetical protein
MSIKNPVIYVPIRHLYNCRERSTNPPFYAKQTQFWNCKMNVTSAYTKDYKENRRKIVMKKQTQFKPNKANFKANYKNELFCVDRNFTMIFEMLLADHTTLKGANCRKGKK